MVHLAYRLNGGGMGTKDSLRLVTGFPEGHRGCSDTSDVEVPGGVSELLPEWAQLS